MKTLKIFMSEITRPRALIFGMKYHLVDLYQVYSNYAPVAKKLPRPGVACLHRENMNKIFLSETTRPQALIFDMKHHLVDRYQIRSNYAPGTKHGSAPEVTCFT